jgi:hypothetical protein
MDNKERRILRNRASAERSRKNKDVLIDSLQQSIAHYDSAIEDMKFKLSDHPCSYLLNQYQSNLSSVSSVDPSFEPAVFVL